MRNFNYLNSAQLIAGCAVTNITETYRDKNAEWTIISHPNTDGSVNVVLVIENAWVATFFIKSIYDAIRVIVSSDLSERDALDVGYIVETLKATRI